MNPDPRPDPDALLSVISQEEASSGRGRLRVYLGANAGVGKTFAMLEWGHERLRNGVDVVVGWVDHHGREETRNLVEGLPVLPAIRTQHRGITLEEFDLDGALNRRPQLLIVDELAHSNAPGSRHLKRWQDVRELLDSGISVATAVNIQHLESLNDVVEQITSVRVRETIPDQVVEKADEVVLVDVSPQELLRRLSEGRIHQTPVALAATEQFFRPGNLLALRELALRFVAGRVGADVEIYRHAQPGKRIWAIQERLLVAVGPSPSSARLIRSTRRLAAALGAPWIAVSVRPAGLPQTPVVRDRAVGHLSLAESLGAEIVLTSGEDIAHEVLSVARNRNVTKIVAGKPIHSWWWSLFRPSPVDRMIRESGDIDVYVISGEGADAAPDSAPRRRPTSALAYGVAALSVAAASGVALPLFDVLDLSDIVMIYLAAVAVTATYASRGATIVVCFLSVIAFNFLFVPPRFSLNVESPRHLTTFAIMFLVGVTISTLAQRLRNQARLAREGERRTGQFARLSARLASARGQEAILLTGMEEIAEAFQTQVMAFRPAHDNRLEFFRGYPVGLPPTERELAVAQWVFEQRRPAGKGTETLDSALMMYLPIMSVGQAPRAVVGLYPPSASERLGADEAQVLQSLCSQTALALEVDYLEEQRRSSEATAESERFRSTILSCVSHDLRTPIASILGCATSLLQPEKQAAPEGDRLLLETIRDEADRMDRLVANLLEMTRLDGDRVRVESTAIPVDDLVGSAIAALRNRLQGRPLDIRIPADLPFVLVDEILMHLVLLNLIENALNYSPPTSPLRISAWKVEEGVCVEVADRGRGLTEGEEGRIFEKFERGSAGQAGPGMGLGLAIAAAIIRAHRGSIGARNRRSGGAAFFFVVPAAEPVDLEGPMP